VITFLVLVTSYHVIVYISFDVWILLLVF